MLGRALRQLGKAFSVIMTKKLEGRFVHTVEPVRTARAVRSGATGGLRSTGASLEVSGGTCVMTDGNAVVISPAVVRTLAEFAALPLSDERLVTIALALQDMLAGRTALAALDLSACEPAAAFDASWP